ncbi:MAG: helix-turn-helix transcriptional regulator [Planctomycetales bacterium]
MPRSDSPVPSRDHRRPKLQTPSATALPPEPPEGHRWTFLTNHAHVLILLSRDPSLILREVALRIGITERAVQRLVAELEEEGYIQRERVGRQNHYRILADKPLRHPIEEHRTVGDLLTLVRTRR